MKNTRQQKILKPLDDFDEAVSLWNIMPSGSGKAVQLLRKIVDQVHEDRFSNGSVRYPSLLIHGHEGKRTLARAFVNSLGFDEADEIYGRFMDADHRAKAFFGKQGEVSHVILDAEKIRPVTLSIIWEMIEKGEHDFTNILGQKENIFISGPLILTTSDIGRVHKSIRDAAGFTVEVEPFSEEQMKLIIHQRLVFCGIKYEGEDVLEAVVNAGGGSVSDSIKLLRMAYVMMRADGRGKLSGNDIERTLRLR
ncbi:hypothetical protein STSP2_01404 [Anaerohalosphaera lusitana]|uniref:Uncharacterized protein n=1 Tax=Anaerohalosphaera lusitana TaxID=1936003 RepID=A0A1U9NKI4_9BACT|nr:hypothetical protein [Anaerohalosphaera lusitana]AQT68248.1 hypothetical protein STSP2_01404 [Anaerohalosphaera lusitana]